MIVTFKCPQCGVEIEAERSILGSRRECPGCHQEVDVPAARVGPGVQLGGFAIVKPLGRGGMGEVFLADQVSMGRKVALKVLPPELTTNREAVERFLHEARMSARLEHPNIVIVLDAGEDDGFYYLAMQYVDGETLEARLQRQRTIPEREALGYLRKVLAALDHAWSHQHILHRDVKPANIMVDQYGEVKLLDMGLAKAILEDSHLTMSGTIVGTPYYMSPEQAKSQRDIDFRSDLYAAGATLYHLLAGAPPFDGDGVVSILTKHVLEPLPPVRQRNAGISEPCARLLDVMLAKDPAHRQASYAAAIADLDAVLAGRAPATRLPAAVPPAAPGAPTTAAPAPSPTAVLAATGRRPRWFIVAAVVAVAVFGVLLVAAGRLARRAPAGMAASAGPAPGVAGGPVAGGVRAPTSGPVAPPPAPVSPRPPAAAAGTPVPDAAGQRLAEMSARLGAIQQFERDHPFEFDAAIARYQELAGLAIGTPQRPLALAAIERLRQKRQTARQTVVARLRAAARAKREAGQPADAAQLIRDYDGPLAAETRAEREQLLQEFRHAEGQQLDARQQAQRAGTDYLDRFATAMLKQDYAAASAVVAAARQDQALAPPRPKFDDELRLADEVSRLPRVLAEAFRPEIGHQTTVGLKRGEEYLLIQAVEGERVRASKVIVEGETRGKLSKDFAVVELTAAERLKRVGDAETPAKQLMRAIVYSELDQLPEALTALQQNGSAVAEAFSRQLGSPAALAFRRLLRQAGLPGDERDPARLQEKYAKAKRTREQREATGAEARAYAEKYGADPFSQPYQELLALLASADPDGNRAVPKGTRAVPGAYADPAKLGDGAADAIRRQREAVAGGLPLEIENSIGMRLRLIPAGLSSSLPGPPPPAGYYLGKFEVTQREWQKLFPERRFSPAAPELPAAGLTLPEVEEFVRLLAERERVPPGTYRLPRDNEWSAACQAGTKGRFYFGDREEDLCRFANYLDRLAPDDFGGRTLGTFKDRAHADGYPGLAPVGSFPPNPLGLYDLYGNVMEYIAPETSRPLAMLPVKGGSCIEPAVRCSAAFRGAAPRRLPPAAAAFPVGCRLLRELGAPMVRPGEAGSMDIGPGLADDDRRPPERPSRPPGGRDREPPSKPFRPAH